MKELLYGAAYYDEYMPYDRLEKDVAMMKKAGMNSVTLGVFAWAAYEPREGEYNFTRLREIMDRLYDQGIYTELATPTGAKPNWLARKYPEVLRVQSNGVRDHQGMRHNHCLTSPIYRQKVEELLNHLKAKNFQNRNVAGS